MLPRDLLTPLSRRDCPGAAHGVIGLSARIKVGGGVDDAPRPLTTHSRRVSPAPVAQTLALTGAGP